MDLYVLPGPRTVGTVMPSRNFGWLERRSWEIINSFGFKSSIKVFVAIDVILNIFLVSSDKIFTLVRSGPFTAWDYPTFDYPLATDNLAVLSGNPKIL